METDSTRIVEILVGLPVVVVGVIDEPSGPLRIVARASLPTPRCAVCGGAMCLKDYRVVELVDLPVFGRPC